MPEPPAADTAAATTRTGPELARRAVRRRERAAAVPDGTSLAAGARVCASALLSLSLGACALAGGTVPARAQCESTGAARPTTCDLPLLAIDDLDYVGAARLPGGRFGSSSLNNALGVIDKRGRSLFIVGHNRDDAIAEFELPELLDSTDLESLPMADGPVQPFAHVLDRATGGNSQGTDYITGLKHYRGRLVVNAHRFYDGAGDNTHTTLVVEDADDIAGAAVAGYFELPGGPRSGGWISEVPPEWEEAIGAPYLTGYASTTAINSRHSLGPSAHALDLERVLEATLERPRIATTRLLEYSLDEPLHADFANESGDNDLWTYKSGAVHGFIVPGTRTYATFGFSGGHRSGIGYKITQNDGTRCKGYCPPDPDDLYNTYWFFDVLDLLEVKAGRTHGAAVRPYAHGTFDVPFQPDVGLNRIGGGVFDAATRILYLTVLGADRLQGRYKNPPVVVGYRLSPG